jgi:hypothetical protein
MRAKKAEKAKPQYMPPADRPAADHPPPLY